MKLQKLLISLLLTFWVAGVSCAERPVKKQVVEAIESIEISDDELYDPAEDSNIQPPRISERNPQTAAAHDEEDKKERGVVPAGDPSIAHDEQAQELVAAVKKQIVDPKEQRRRGIFDEGLSCHILGGVRPLTDLIGRLSQSTWADTGEIKTRRLWQAMILNDRVRSLAISADGEWIVLRMNNAERSRVQQYRRDGEFIAEVPVESINYQRNIEAVSGNGEYVLIGSTQDVNLYNRNFAQELLLLKSYYIQSVGITVDGEHLFVGFNQDNPISRNREGIINVYNRDGMLIHTFACPGRLDYAVMSGDGEYIGVAMNKQVRMYKKDGTLVYELEDNNRPAWRISSQSIALSGDGEYAVTVLADKIPRLRDKHGHVLKEFAKVDGDFPVVAISGDGQYVVVSGYSRSFFGDPNETRIYSRDGELLQRLYPDQKDDEVSSVAISYHGKTIVIGFLSAGAVLWTLEE